MDLWDDNDPASFWQLEVSVPEHEWCTAITEEAPTLGLPGQTGNVADLLWMTLGEGQFGREHFDPSAVNWLYYRFKSCFPTSLALPLRRVLGSVQRRRSRLGWPHEERYARFLWLVARDVVARRGRGPLRYRRFWPGDARFAFVLTHDVETARGQEFVRAVADLDESYGLRSSFNFIPERYPLDLGLIDDLKRRGFEVGIHGLKHDGKLFDSKKVFMQRAERINRYIGELGAVGFRAPFVMRHPEWMQALDVEYDASFFDTDPYQPIPGGTMSLWPFFLGKFVELPYTLSQDCVLSVLLRERTPVLWLRKLELIARYHGMALVNTHPDFLRLPPCWRIYERLLQAISERRDYWHALPCRVARWWRQRATRQDPDPAWGTLDIDEAGCLRVDGAVAPAPCAYHVARAGAMAETGREALLRA